VVPDACVGPNSTDTLLSAWAPGAGAIVYPSDVGVDLTPYPTLVLQVTYDNRSAAAGRDASGIGYCTTDEERPNIAGTVLLGTEIGISIPGGAQNQIGGTATCTNLSRQAPVNATIIASLPRMNGLGSGFTTEQFRAGERVAYVSNVPIGTWQSGKQARILHFEPSASRIEVLPGDSLQTKCYYTNPGAVPVGFGLRTQDELCYNIVIAYPIARLKKRCDPYFCGFCE
jgi:hypothetical protein